VTNESEKSCCSQDGSCHCADQLEHVIASVPKCTCSIDGTPYCKAHAEPKPKPINGTTGELKIWKPDDTLVTLYLTEEDMWALMVSVKTTEKQAVNEPGFANGNGKAALINLATKLKVASEADAQMGCTNKTCGCKK